jgi:hypothetical protein
MGHCGFELVSDFEFRISDFGFPDSPGFPEHALKFRRWKAFALLCRGALPEQFFDGRGQAGATLVEQLAAFALRKPQHSRG